MSFNSKLKLDSKFFRQSERRRAFGNAAYEAAQKMRRDGQQKMLDSEPAGREVITAEGDGFQTRFRRSKRGQRPAVQTGRLLNSYRAKRTGDLSATLTVVAETDEGFDYGAELEKLGRQVVTEEDRRDAERDFARRQRRALIDLI